MGLADELLEDARHLAQKGIAESRASCMRRAVSTAYYAVFHLLVEDFVANWPFPDQRGRLARMFDHRKMREAAFTPEDRNNPTEAESDLVDIKTAFRQLQADRHTADYDLSWNIVGTDVEDAVTLAEETFTKWRSLCTENVTRHSCFRCSAQIDDWPDLTFYGLISKEMSANVNGFCFRSGIVQPSFL